MISSSDFGKVNPLFDFILTINMEKLRSFEMEIEILPDDFDKKVEFMRIFLSNLKKKIPQMENLENFSFGLERVSGSFLQNISEFISPIKSLKILKIDLK